MLRAAEKIRLHLIKYCRRWLFNGRSIRSLIKACEHSYRHGAASSFSIWLVYARYEIYTRSELQIRARHQRPPPPRHPGKVVKQEANVLQRVLAPAIVVDRRTWKGNLITRCVPVNDNGAVNGSSTIINGLDRRRCSFCREQWSFRADGRAGSRRDFNAIYYASIYPYR